MSCYQLIITITISHESETFTLRRAFKVTFEFHNGATTECRTTFNHSPNELTQGMALENLYVSSFGSAVDERTRNKLYVH